MNINNLRRLLFFTFIFLPVQALAYENIADYDDLEGWIEVYPPRYDTVEQFFLDQGCKFYQGAAHIYNLDNEHWLTASEVEEVHPEISSDITNLECELYVSKEDLALLLHTDELATEGRVLLYFDMSRDENNGDLRKVLTASMLADYYQKLERLSEVDDIPKYRIITSRVGFRSQFQ